MPIERVTFVSTFPRAAVLRLLDAAEAIGRVDLAKDTGAYLMTWTAQGDPIAEVQVYAEGHEPPPSLAGGQPRDTIDGAWLDARAATDRVWGGDDFGETLTTDVLRQALGEAGDLRIQTTLQVHPWPAEMPPDLRGRRDPLHELESIDLLLPQQD